MRSSRARMPMRAAWLGLALAVSGMPTARAESPTRPPTPPPAVAAPAPTPAQLAASLAGVRKEVRRQSAVLREARARLERTAKEAATLQAGFIEQRDRLNAAESIVTSLMGAVILLGVLAIVLLAAVILSGRRLAELEFNLENGLAAPTAVRRGLQEIEERLRRLEEEEEFPQRAPASAPASGNGEGAPAPYRE